MKIKYLIDLFIGSAHCSRSVVNGDLVSSAIPEESKSVSKERSELEETLSSFSS